MREMMSFGQTENRTMRHAPRIAAFVLGCLLLSACGFHLRGNYHPPAFLHEVTLRTPANSRDLNTELQLALARNNIQGGRIHPDLYR